jgi:hypothetical protein
MPWQDERHEVGTLPKSHRGRTRVLVTGPTGIEQPTVADEPWSGRARSVWAGYRRGIIRVYRREAVDALARLVGLSLELALRRPRGGLGSYFVADVDLGVDLYVRIKQ